MTNEYILIAAIWYKDLKPVKAEVSLPLNCDRGIVITGYRHGQCIRTCLNLTGLRTVSIAEDAVGEFEQGFLTSRNRFVTRREAAEIALVAGQIKEMKKELFSEDLY